MLLEHKLINKYAKLELNRYHKKTRHFARHSDNYGNTIDKELVSRRLIFRHWSSYFEIIDNSNNTSNNNEICVEHIESCGDCSSFRQYMTNDNQYLIVIRGNHINYFNLYKRQWYFDNGFRTSVCSVPQNKKELFLNDTYLVTFYDYQMSSIDIKKIKPTLDESLIGDYIANTKHIDNINNNPYLDENLLKSLVKINSKNKMCRYSTMESIISFKCVISNIDKNNVSKQQLANCTPLALRLQIEAETQILREIIKMPRRYSLYFLNFSEMDDGRSRYNIKMLFTVCFGSSGNYILLCCTFDIMFEIVMQTRFGVQYGNTIVTNIMKPTLVNASLQSIDNSINNDLILNCLCNDNVKDFDDELCNIGHKIIAMSNAASKDLCLFVFDCLTQKHATIILVT